MALSAKEAPFTEPYAVAGNPRGFRSKGPTAEAVKRALAHLGFLPWKADGNWDQHWNADVNAAAAKWKAKRGIIPSGSTDGSWGERSHEVMRSTWFEKNGQKLAAFDSYAQKLLQDEYAAAQKPPPSNAKGEVQKKLTEFAKKALGRKDWRYSQNRAVKLSVEPDGPNTSDCSGSVMQAFYWARGKTGVKVPDPSQQNWTGYGNTSYYQDDWPTVTSGKYEVGDLAHYNGHVTYCYEAGDWNTSTWFSFGSEPPSSRKLGYRSDFRKVVRPPLVPS